MPRVYRLNHQPDVDLNWDVNPGACSYINGLVPLQNGNMGTINGNANTSFNVTGEDILHGQMFMQTDGTVRLLAFRKNDIDEYASDSTRTNRATGLTTSTGTWSAASWGNQIIAVSKQVATQSSTGAGFTALGGSPPKAARIASNVNFVMVADVDDGGSNVYPDMVWWSGIRNPATWTPSQATQAGNVRLLDTPGAITELVAYGNKFVAFKENAIYLGTYIGPPYVFSWQVVSSNIGCSYPKAVAECDGRLYFVHNSGFYSFDGQSVQNIGVGIASIVDEFRTSDKGNAVADEKEGVVWFATHGVAVGGGTYYTIKLYPYNVRTGLWGGVVISDLGSGTGRPQALVKSTYAERFAFGLGNGGTIAYFDNDTSPRFRVCVYPDTPTIGPAIYTGYVGNNDVAGRITRTHVRMIRGVGAAPTLTSAYLYGYSDENGSSADTTKSLTWNSEFLSLDGAVMAKYAKTEIQFSNSTAKMEVAGIGFDVVYGGKR